MRDRVEVRRVGLPYGSPPVRRPTASTGSAGRHAPVMWLQRTVGNAAVTSLLERPTVQRSPAFGLARVGPTSGFAGAAVTFWRSNPEKTLLDLGTELMKKANDALKVEHVPPATPSFNADRRRGHTSSEHWTINVDLAQITSKPVTTKLRDITAEEAAEVAATCFHEARHAEQSFLSARVLASRDKQDAAGIVASIGIEAHVAKAAYDLRATPPDKAILPTVDQWRAFELGGKHFDYKAWNDTFMEYLKNTVAAQKDPTNLNLTELLEEQKKLDHNIGEWKKDTMPFVRTKSAAVKADRARGPMGNQVLADLARIQRGFDKLVRANAKFSDKEAELRRAMADVQAGRRAAFSKEGIEAVRLRFVSELFSVRVALAEFNKVTEDAYKNYAHEADAWAVAGGVKKVFATAATKKP